MRTALWLRIALALALGVAACTMASPGSEPANLVGTAWDVVSVNGASPAGGQPTMSFGDGTITGSAGCNGYNATARVEGDRLVVEAVMIGRMMCAPEGLALDGAVLGILQSGARLALAQDRLVIVGPEGELVLVRR